jgi:hypothetical protein
VSDDTTRMVETLTNQVEMVKMIARIQETYPGERIYIMAESQLDEMIMQAIHEAVEAQRKPKT